MATYTVKAGSTGGTYKAGDIVNFQGGEYTYFVLRGNATKDNPIVLNFPEKCLFKNGFDVVDSGGFVFNGMNNLVCNCTGTPFSFAGKCHDVTIKDVLVQKCSSSVWWKTEVNDTRFANWNYWKKNADGTIEASYVMDGLTIFNMTVEEGTFDNMYLGSTDHPPSRGGVTIDGEHFNPRPPSVSNIRLENIVIKKSSRTGIQISGLVGEGSYIRKSKISNSGTGKEAYQGASFRIGGDSPGGFEISDCEFDGSWIYNIHSQGGGKIIFKNNKVANSCKGNPEKMAAVEFDTNKDYPATIEITGNEIDGSNNNVSIVVYPDKRGGGVNAGTLSNNKLAGDFQNFSGVAFKTKTDTTPVEPPADPAPIDTTPTKPTQPAPALSPISSFVLNTSKQEATLIREDGSTTLLTNIDRIIGRINPDTKKKEWFMYHPGDANSTRIN